VETLYHRLVMNSLSDGLAETIEDDPQLGLTLVRLTNVSEAADRVRKERSDVQMPARGQDWSDLDVLLANLRAVYQKDYAWTPGLGKNRTMDKLQFVTYPNAERPPRPYFADGHGPEPASADELGNLGTSGQDSALGQGVRVGLPDTKLYEHRLLAGRYIAEKSTLLPPPSQEGRFYLDGHAAFCSSIILAQAPAAELDVRAILPDDAKQDRSIWDVAREMARYLSSGVQIINCSWGTCTRDGKAPFALERAIALLTPTIVVVAGAGNHGLRTPKVPGSDGPPLQYAPAFPAALPNVVAVGALDRDHAAAEFNPTVNRQDGSLAPWINLLAPGVDVLGAYFGDMRDENVLVPKPPAEKADPEKPTYDTTTFSGAATWSGTSFSAAYVTGAIARRMGPPGDDGASAQEALDELRKGADDNIRLAHR
jgi:hypothetical protein